MKDFQIALAGAVAILTIVFVAAICIAFVLEKFREWLLVAVKHDEEYAAIRGLVRRLIVEGYAARQIMESFGSQDRQHVAKALVELTGLGISAPPPPRPGRQKRNGKL